MTGSNRHRKASALAAALATILSGAAAAQVGFNFSPIEQVDPRVPLEIPRSERFPPYDSYLQPVLFDQTPNSLEMVRFDVTQNPPVASPIQIASGNSFALGSATEISDTVGFSFIDPLFDLRFGGCTAPCTSTFNNLINAGTWIDSASSASANTRYVVALNNAMNHGIQPFRSTDNGGSWSPDGALFTPPVSGGVYDNFHGGKRISLLVDRTSTNPTTTRNCITYETLEVGGTTIQWFKCRDGQSDAFTVPFDTDVPNPSNQFDRFIETCCLPLPDGAGGFRTLCTYSHRQTQRMRAVRISQTGVVTGPVDLGDVPKGSNFYNPDLLPFREQEREDFLALFPGGDLPPARFREWDPAAGLSGFSGPPLVSGPVRSDFIFRSSGPQRPEIWAMGGYFEDPRVEGTFGGLGLVIDATTIFFDGFETANVLRWSHHVP